MAGWLGRWLEILRQGVKYGLNAKDNCPLGIGHHENMVLLTRDEELYRRAIDRKITSALVLGETEEERLAQMANIFGLLLDADMAETKCPECGSDLKETPKNDLVDEVPLASLELYNQFWKCTNSNCGKVYWVGSHWKQMRHTLEEARRLARLVG